MKTFSKNSARLVANQFVAKFIAKFPLVELIFKIIATSFASRQSFDRA
jgi:hypothetical protein